MRPSNPTQSAASININSLDEVSLTAKTYAIDNKAIKLEHLTFLYKNLMDTI